MARDGAHSGIQLTGIADVLAAALTMTCWEFGRCEWRVVSTAETVEARVLIVLGPREI